MRKPTIAIICIAIVLTAITANIIIVKTAPKAERKTPPRMAPLVETQKLVPANQTVVLELTGTVIPAEEISLLAQVGGEVISMSPDFMEGGILSKGDKILQIEPVDYELALASAQSAFVKAQFDYKMELGRQDVAKREWELLKTDDASDLEKELALRIPHLAASEASLEAAESSLKKARLNLSRTKVMAPFDAVVLDRNVNVGSQINTIGQQLGRLVGTDTYWVQVSIPVDRLGWVSIPGSAVKIISPSGAERTGAVIKLLGNLEERGRMARLLVEIKDPLCINPENAEHKPLLLGEYVRVEINGRILNNTFSIPRNALRENGVIWIATTEEKLDIRNVEVLWRDSSTVLIQNGISDGELLVVSDLTAPINGMDVNTGGETTTDKPKKKLEE
jgi:RND family efflux transporter MFP subunit